MIREQEKAVKIHSYTIAAVYFFFAIFCWFFFYHHPTHCGVSIRKSKPNATNFGFVVDNTRTIWNPAYQESGTQAGGIRPPDDDSLIRSYNSRQNQDDDQQHDLDVTSSLMVQQDVTLIDAYKIRDINLLVASYLFYSCHFVFVLMVDEKRT